MRSDRHVRKAAARRLGAGLAALAAALLLASCAQQTVSRAVTITSTAEGAGFDPDTITVDKGDTAVLTVRNASSREHGFSISGFRVEEVVAPGATVEVRIEASRAGTFRIFCQLHETHRAATLVVR